MTAIPAWPNTSDSQVIFDHFGPETTVAVPTRRVPGTELIYLNTPWLAREGFEVFPASKRSRLEHAFLNAFSLQSVVAGVDGNGPELRADRYGASGGSPHGGSGRAASIGPYNLKGIGRTPLVAQTESASHRDGRLSLVEAIREAISSEIAAAELPGGAVPILAIIALPPRIANENYAQRDAIVVRPNVLRPAHFERSIFFGNAGFAGSDQFRDAIRVSDFVRYATTKADALTSHIPGGFCKWIAGIAHQLGAMHAHRLWQGKFLSANITVAASLLDFGSFRAVPTWHAYYGKPEERFGSEPAYLASAIRSLHKHFAKYSAAPLPPLDRTLTHAATAIEGGFQEAVTNVLGHGLDAARATAVADILHRYFQRQQSSRCQIGDALITPLFWLEWHSSDPNKRPGVAERRVWDEIGELLEGTGTAGDDAAHRLRHWLAPRANLYYEVQRPAIGAFLEGLKGTKNSAACTAFIENSIGAARRHFPGLRGVGPIVGHAISSGTEIVYRRRPAGDQLEAWFRTYPIAGSDLVWLLGKPLPRDNFASADLDANDGWISRRFEEDVLTNGGAFSIKGRNFELPPASIEAKKVDRS